MFLNEKWEPLVEDVGDNWLTYRASKSKKRSSDF